MEVQVSVFMPPRGRVAQLYPEASVFVSSYYSHGYGGCILTSFLTGREDNYGAIDWEEFGRQRSLSNRDTISKFA
jgi:hypothetical protein